MLRSAALCALPVILAFAPLGAAIPSALSPSPLLAASPPAAQKQSKHTKFRVEFDAAVKAGSKKKMDKLVEDLNSEAIFAVIETADAISNAPNDVLYDRFNGLRESWYRLYSNDFPDQLELFFVNLTPAEKKARRKVKIKYDQLLKTRNAAVAAKDLPGLIAISQQYERVADQFQTMGDQYFESDARIAAADIADEFYHKKKTDYQRVATLFERAIALRDELGIKDITYRQSLPRMKALVGLGFGSGAPDPSDVVESEPDAESKDDVDDGGEEGTPLVEAGQTVTIDMTYAELKGLKDTERPNYYLDGHRQIWPTVSLGATGDIKDIPRLGADSPKIMRIGDAKVGIDTDRDGTSDLPWPTRGKLDTVSFEIGEGPAKRRWGLLVEVGRQQDFYQGITLNLAQTTDNINLYYIPGGEMVGDIGGVSIELYDDNLDGTYGSGPSSWAFNQLRPGTNQPELDSIRIGGEKKARPMSEHVDIPGAGWHKIESLNGGNQVALTPVRFKTGTIQLKAKGIKPKFVILKGNGDKLGNTFVDISGGKKVEVPTGRWDLYFGILSEGKKMQVVKAVILPSNASPSYDVKEGGKVEVQFGAPFAFDFEVEKLDDQATVQGMSVQVIGSGGEAYDRFYGAVPRPEASIRKTGSKRGFATDKMVPAASQGDIAKYGWNQTWKPLSAVFPTKQKEVEVQLFEKKNKLFGKVESAWL